MKKKLYLQTEYNPRGIVGWFEVWSERGQLLSKTLKFGDIAAARLIALPMLVDEGHEDLVAEGSRIIDVLIEWLRTNQMGGTVTFSFQDGRPKIEEKYVPNRRPEPSPSRFSAVIGGRDGLRFRPVGSGVPELTLGGLFRYLRQAGVATEVDERRWRVAVGDGDPEDEDMSGGGDDPACGD